MELRRRNYIFKLGNWSTRQLPGQRKLSTNIRQGCPPMGRSFVHIWSNLAVVYEILEQWFLIKKTYPLCKLVICLQSTPIYSFLINTVSLPKICKKYWNMLSTFDIVFINQSISLHIFKNCGISSAGYALEVVNLVQIVLRYPAPYIEFYGH